MPTMAEVAQEQINNPENAYLRDMAQSFQQPPPAGNPNADLTQQAQGHANIQSAALPGFGAPASPGGIPQGGTLGPMGDVNAPPSKDKWEALRAAALAAHGPQATPSAAAAPAGPPNPTGATPAQAAQAAHQVPGAAPYTGLKDYEENNQGRLGATRDEQAVMRDRYVLMANAADKRQDALDKAQTEYDSSKLGQEMLEQHVRDNTEVAHREMEQQWAEQRAKKVDPQKFFKDRGTIGSVVAALAMGAGAFAAAMPHAGSNTNQAGEIIRKAVDRDVDAQQADIDKGFKDLQFKGDENEKKYVQDQREVAQKRQRTMEGLQSARAVAQDYYQRAADQSQQMGLKATIDDLDKQYADEKDKDVDHRVAIARQQAAQAAAAANADKERRKQVTELASKIMLDPNHTPKEGMTKGESALRLADGIINRNQSNLDAGTVTKDKKDEGGVDVGKQAAGIPLKSTEWQGLTRGFQGTDAFKNVEDQQSYNSLVLTQVHKNGIRDPDKAREVMAPYIIEKGDSQETIELKNKNFLRDYGGAGTGIVKGAEPY